MVLYYTIGKLVCCVVLVGAQYTGTGSRPSTGAVLSSTTVSKILVRYCTGTVAIASHSILEKGKNAA